MSTYAIGDVQGCFSVLEKLLTNIHFDSSKDRLWFAGDIVNRGPQSLETLRFIRHLAGNNHQLVLGNHDLHLLARAASLREDYEGDTLQEILNASDRDDLLQWLRQRPLLVYDETLNVVMTHAGLAPMWSLQDAKRLAKEVETVLQSDNSDYLLANMYGNLPNKWSETLTGTDRLRCIVNYFTRMRFCTQDGAMDLSYKGDIAHKPADLIPWFNVPSRVALSQNIVFGHWAALQGNVNVPNLYALDTGCVWGGALTAMRLEDKAIFQVSAV